MTYRGIRIVGGGLTGIVAAFSAVELGFRSVTLYERFDRLGGVALSDRRGGLEIRDGTIYFGPPGDRLNAMFERQGLDFDYFPNRFGSISPSRDGAPAIAEDFGGPALADGGAGLSPIRGNTLADRYASYPAPIGAFLDRYTRWHLETDPADLHESAAVPLAVNRVWPIDLDPEVLAATKRSDPLWDELYGMPRSLHGWTSNLQASVPAGGFDALFRRCEARLQDLGVKVEPQRLVSPREMLELDPTSDVVVWAANPMPLFKAVGLASPALVRKVFRTVVWAARRWSGPTPFYVQNFTLQGAIFRLNLYPSAGRLLVCAECAGEASYAELEAEAARLAAPFGVDLSLGQIVSDRRGPRWIYHSVAAIEGLARLRAELGRRFGDAFVPGAWESYGKSAKADEVIAGLRRAAEPSSHASAKTG